MELINIQWKAQGLKKAQIVTNCQKGYKVQGNEEGAKTENIADLRDKWVSYSI